MFVQNLLLACWSCLNGHRARTCNHTHRPLYALKNKGRPRSTTPRSKDSPDILSLHDASFTTFVSNVLNDPILKKEYFHAENPTTRPAKRPTPYPKRVSQLGKRGCGGVAGEEAQDTVDIYEGWVGEDGVRRWRELCGLVDVVLGPVVDAPGFTTGDGVAISMVESPVTTTMTSPFTSPSAVLMDPVLALESVPSSPFGSETSFLGSRITSPMTTTTTTTNTTMSGDDTYSPNFVYDDYGELDPHLFDMVNSFIRSSSFSPDETPSFTSEVLRDGQILPMQWEKHLETLDRDLAMYSHGSPLFTGLFDDPFTGLTQDINYLNTADCIAH